MQKIISLFERNYLGDRLVRDEVVPGAEWVLEGEGVATRKFDGTSCFVKDAALYKRFDAKKGRAVPEGFMPSQDPDEVTGHWPGWVPVGPGPEDQWHREAVLSWFKHNAAIPPGTYELIGPKVQGNAERVERHQLVRHGDVRLADAPRSFEGLRTYLGENDIEGIVWHHPDGRMVKIKARDFGLKRPRP